MKTDKIETKQMNTTDKKNIKRKKIETVEFKTFAVVDHCQMNFFLSSFASHEQKDFA